MKIFITGVTGYIGHNLMLSALMRGHKVHALVRPGSTLETFRHRNLNCMKGDITDFEAVVDAMKGCDAVIHTAGFAGFGNKDRTMFYKVNVGGTKNVLEAAIYNGIKRLVFTSSCAVIGPSYSYPLNENSIRYSAFENDYEISKYRAEEMVKEYAGKGLWAVIVSPPRVYGPGLMTKGNPVNKLIRNMIKRHFAFVPKNGEVVGNYAFIEDVVDGHFFALEKGIAGEKYILGGENISYNRFFSSVRDLSGKTITMIPLPKSLLKIGSAVVSLSCRIAGVHTHISPGVVERLLQNRAVSCEKAIRNLGYHVTPFEKGIYMTIQHLRSGTTAKGPGDQNEMFS